MGCYHYHKTSFDKLYVLRFYAGSSPARSVLGICDSERLCQWFPLRKRHSSFFGKVQFPQSFGWFAQSSVEIVPFDTRKFWNYGVLRSVLWVRLNVFRWPTISQKAIQFKTPGNYNLFEKSKFLRSDFLSKIGLVKNIALGNNLCWMRSKVIEHQQLMWFLLLSDQFD